MKHFLVIPVFMLICCSCTAQEKSYAFRQLYQLDSIGKSSSISRYFGELYFQFLQRVEQQLQKSDTATQRLVRNFEIVFAQFYIDACIAHHRNEQVPLPAWRAYFADKTLEPVQYKLLGANAHLNGGLSEAIAGSYTDKEWRSIKSKYCLFNICLNNTYKHVYEETVTKNKRAKIFDKLTLGLDNYLGKYFLYKWRKRQMRLTEYNYTGTEKYKKFQAKVDRKKNRIDKIVVTWL